MKRAKLLLVVVVLVALWFVLRPEMCSPNHPYADGTGSSYSVRYSDGSHANAKELIELQGPLVDLCVGDRHVYGGDLICLAAVGIFSIGGPGRIWLCPCSQGAARLRNETPKATFNGSYQTTCVYTQTSR